jgi:O-antigen ligase
MSPQVWARLKFFTVAILCLGVYLFLRDRGAELIESRIEYGLLHSKEDMRFQLLADTWPLIVAHPWFGLGVGSWASAYAEVMSPLLAGITPVYLHNDPAQLLAETGLFGFVIVLGGLGALVIKGARAIFASPHRLTLIALVAALTTTFISTAFDFHLRIPAIVIQLGVIIGLLIDFTDRAAR